MIIKPLTIIILVKDSLKIKKANTEAIMGSPNGTDAITLGETYLIA